MRDNSPQSGTHLATAECSFHKCTQAGTFSLNFDFSLSIFPFGNIG